MMGLVRVSWRINPMNWNGGCCRHRGDAMIIPLVLDVFQNSNGEYYCARLEFVSTV